MAKITAIKTYKKNGGTIIAGYKVALRKLDTEKSGFNEGDEVEIKYDNKKITITSKK